jgi:adenine phosphoribosyltransferase
MNVMVKNANIALRGSIRSIADYPKPGIMFRDITTLLGDARAFRRAIDELV